MTSRIASLIATGSFRGGAFLMSVRLPDDVARAITFLNDPDKRPRHLVKIRGFRTQPAQTGLRIHDRSCDGLIDLMGN